MPAILFLLAYASGCLLSITRHPIFGLITYVLTYYIHPPARWWGELLPDLRWSLLAALVTLVSTLTNSARMNKVESKPATSILWIFGLFFTWLLVQFPWAMNTTMHMDLTVLYAKYFLLIWIFIKCIDTTKHLEWFCWTHVVGCTYLGWVAFSNYDGGRFEGFGGPDINEANAGALQMVSAIFIGAALFLMPSVRRKLGTLLTMPLVVNAMILTGSRSAFLASAAGGVLFNLMSPKKLRWTVRSLSIVAAVVFVMHTNPEYWTRISTIKAAGSVVEGVDTGSGRLLIITAQWQMFADHPLGCGHRCTAVLSPRYMDDSMLTGPTGNRARSSHNTFMSLLVEQGIPGAIFYFMYLAWVIRQIIRLIRTPAPDGTLLNTLAPAIMAFFVAVTVGDLFVDYLKSEVRIWFISMLVVAVALSSSRNSRPLIDSSEPRINTSPTVKAIR